MDNAVKTTHPTRCPPNSVLFGTFSESAKELWEALKNKYMSEDASSMNFLVSHFNNYKMVEEHFVLDQLHEIQHILSHFKQHNMQITDSIIVTFVMDELLLRNWLTIFKLKMNCVCKMNQRSVSPRFI